EGDMTMAYLERFLALVNELERDPRVVVERAHIGPPASPGAIANAERVFGAALAPEVVAFYRELDGFSLRWVLAKHAKKSDRVRKTGPLEAVDGSNTTPGP